MGITLVEYAKNNPDPLNQAVIMEFAETSDILANLPFKNVDGGGYGYLREEKLPGIAYRGINEAFETSHGILNPVFDPLTIAGGDIDTDKFLVDQYGPERRIQERRMKVKALALRWTKTFVKGDSSTNSREFDGLQRRLVNSQLIWNTATNATAGSGLSLNKLDEVIDRVTQPTHILMNKALRRQLSAASRNQGVGGFITFEQDAFGRRVSFYQDLPIVIIDEDNDGNQILNFDEGSANGGTGLNSSIYVISAGDAMLSGIQGGVSADGSLQREYGIRTFDLGLQTDDNKSVLRDRVEWYSGIALQHSRCAARLAGITNAAVVA